MNQPRTFTRTRILSLDLISGEITEPSGAIPVPPPRRAHVVVRLHQRPIGAVDIDLDGDDDVARVAEKAAFLSLQESIKSHFERLGEKPPASLDELKSRPNKPCSEAIPIPSDSPPRVTVAIATVANTRACIDTVKLILKCCYPNFEVVVVDNSPKATELEQDLTRQLDDERVRYVVETRKGLSFARNCGLREASGEIVIFTDDDVVVDNCWISAIVSAFMSDEQVACVTGAIMTSEIETPAQAWLEQYGGYHKGFERTVYDLEENRVDSPLYPYDAGRFGSGANIAFRKKELEGMGGFSTDLGAGTPAHGGEDIDVLRRAITSGYKLAYEPAALMWHHHRRDHKALRRQMYRYGVGLSATVTRWLLTDRQTSIAVIKRIPIGLGYVLSASSRKNSQKNTNFPSELTWLERMGIAAGPFLYLKSRREIRRRESIAAKNTTAETIDARDHS